MKFKALFAMMLAGALAASAQSQGYKDGIEYYKAGQYENALTILQNTFNQAGTDKAMANYYLGQTELALDHKDKALKYFQDGVAANPECGYNYVGLGAIDLLNGNAKAADEQFKFAQKTAKKNYEVIVDIARAYYKADPVKYAKEVDKYLAKAHKDSKHTEPSIYILEGDMLVDQKEFGNAAGKYEMAIGYDNHNPEGYVKYANSYFHVNPQFSINKLKEFLAVAPESALGQRELAEKLYEANFWKQASEQYGKYINNPNHFPQYKARYSVLLYYGEDYPASLKVAKEVLAQQPDNFLMQRLRFLNETQMGQFDQAVKDGESFFKNNPNGYFTSNDYTTLADAYSGMGNDSTAVETLKTAADKFPENGALQQQLSATFTKAKMYADAARAYDKYMATVEKPDVNDYFTGSGRWLNAGATAGDNQELRAEASKKGLEYVDKAMAEVSDNPMLLQRKARLIMAGNNSKPNAEVVAEYQKLLDLLNKDPKNADPANPQNELNMYKEICLFSIQYYNDIEPDKDKAAEFSALYREVNDKINGTTTPAE